MTNRSCSLMGLLGLAFLFSSQAMAWEIYEKNDPFDGEIAAFWVADQNDPKNERYLMFWTEMESGYSSTTWSLKLDTPICSDFFDGLMIRGLFGNGRPFEMYSHRANSKNALVISDEYDLEQGMGHHNQLRIRLKINVAKHWICVLISATRHF